MEGRRRSGIADELSSNDATSLLSRQEGASEPCSIHKA